MPVYLSCNVLFCLATLAYITYSELFFCYIKHRFRLLCGTFSLSPSSKGFQKFKRFQNACYFSLYVKLWGTAQRLVSHISPSRKLAKKKQRISDFFGMVSVWLFPSICLSSEIHIFKQKMCKCSIVRDKLSVEMIVVSYFRIRLYK